MKKKHQKHTKLIKPDLGFFARNEWAIIGTPCGNIKKIAFELTDRLSAVSKVAYVDADHKSEENENSTHSALDHQGSLEYTDKIDFHRFDTKAKLDTYQYRQHFNEQDVVLVNGNHFKAKCQIVVIDEKKLESLSRKLDRLTDVQLILLEEGSRQIPSFLKEHLPNISTIPIWRTNEMEKTSNFLLEEMKKRIAPLSGVVLAGGKSQRMGRDKGLIDFHGKAQREYVADLLNEVCEKTMLSCRADQTSEINSAYPLLVDQFVDLGPFGAILSAFRQNPNKAYLFVACDLPLIDKSVLKELIANRNSSKIATCFQNPVTNFPEPLITIWEPKSYAVLLQFFAQGFSCPRKILINSDIHLLEASNPKALLNVNRPEDLEEVKALVKGLK